MTRRILSSATSLTACSGSVCASSSRTRWNEVSSPISSSFDTARLWRSSDFGVIRISGLRMSRFS